MRALSISWAYDPVPTLLQHIPRNGPLLAGIYVGHDTTSLEPTTRDGHDVLADHHFFFVLVDFEEATKVRYGGTVHKRLTAHNRLRCRFDFRGGFLRLILLLFLRHRAYAPWAEGDGLLR